MDGRSAMLAAALATALLAAGCAQDGNAMDAQDRVSAEDDGVIALTLEADRTALQTGETLGVKITAKNISDEAVEIVSRNAARAFVEVRRYDGVRWQQVTQYPQAAAMVITPWRLEPDGEEVWNYELPVEPQWPTAEEIQLRAYLSGYERVDPTLVVRVSPK